MTIPVLVVLASAGAITSFALGMIVTGVILTIVAYALSYHFVTS